MYDDPSRWSLTFQSYVQVDWQCNGILFIIIHSLSCIRDVWILKLEASLIVWTYYMLDMPNIRSPRDCFISSPPNPLSGLPSLLILNRGSINARRPIWFVHFVSGVQTLDRATECFTCSFIGGRKPCTRVLAVVADHGTPAVWSMLSTGSPEPHNDEGMWPTKFALVHWQQCHSGLHLNKIWHGPCRSTAATPVKG